MLNCFETKMYMKILAKQQWVLYNLDYNYIPQNITYQIKFPKIRNGKSQISIVTLSNYSA